MVLHPFLETMIVEIGKGVQQGLLAPSAQGSGRAVPRMLERYRNSRSCGLVSFADGPDGGVPRLFRMRGEMIAHPLLKVGWRLDNCAI